MAISPQLQGLSQYLNPMPFQQSIFGAPQQTAPQNFQYQVAQNAKPGTPMVMPPPQQAQPPQQGPGMLGSILGGGQAPQEAQPATTDHMDTMAAADKGQPTPDMGGQPMPAAPSMNPIVGGLTGLLGATRIGRPIAGAYQGYKAAEQQNYQQAVAENNAARMRAAAGEAAQRGEVTPLQAELLSQGQAEPATQMNVTAQAGKNKLAAVKELGTQRLANTKAVNDAKMEHLRAQWAQYNALLKKYSPQVLGAAGVKPPEQENDPATVEVLTGDEAQ